MRIKLSRHLKLLLVLGVLVLAFLYARGFFAPRVTISPEVREVWRLFRDANNFQKHDIRFNVEDMNDFMFFLGTLEGAHTDSLRVLQRRGNESSLIYLAEIRSGDFEQFVQRLRSFDSSSEPIEQRILTPVLSVDLTQRLEMNEMLLQRLQTESQTATTSRFDQIQRSMTSLRTEIDSLKVFVEAFEHNSTNSLLLLVVGTARSPIAVFVRNNTVFIRDFGVGFIVLTFTLIASIFLMNLVLKLMSKFGIHTTSGKGGSGKYGGYKYGSYKYGSKGYGGGQRKVKRVYKDKDKKDTPESDKSE